jgi:FdrA protein
VLVSVPGAHAAAEAWDALDAGSSVMLFSDNVGVQDEVALKTAAAQRGLLVMGPDCGTAVVGGVGLGFANVVRPGPVSLVAASGTGAQHLMALLDQAGVGVRHCLGLGGRDLSAAVGGLGARSALDVLAADDATELVVVVSKPADPQVVSQLERHAAALGTPLVWAVLGPDRPDLTAVAEQVLARVGAPVPAWPTWGAPPPPGGDGLLRGLFAGGTLCDEAMALAARRLGPVASNVPLDPSWPVLDATGPAALSAAFDAAGHAVVDLGDDALTVGRAHPMIDPTLRLEALAGAAADPRVRVVLMDVVLGHGAHPDPAAPHAPAVEQALATARADGRRLDVVVSLVGTGADPQGLERQGEALAAAGAYVLVSNARAAAAALDLVAAR